MVNPFEKKWSGVVRCPRLSKIFLKVCYMLRSEKENKDQESLGRKSFF